MDFVSVILLLGVYFIRPQEWTDLLESLRPAFVTLAFALVAMLFRERGFSLRNLVRAPHDWLVLLFFGWALYSDPDGWGAWAELKVLLVCYVVVSQALNSWARMNRFMGWWMGLIFFIALLALGSVYGIDPLGSYDLTNNVQAGRLSLNLSIFRNPNALGHNLVPVLPLLYFLLIWRRPIFTKEIGLLLLAVPAYCLFLTESKGAFISAFITLIAGWTFGRPRIMQIVVLIAALTVGWAAVKQMPRMEQITSPHSDEGIVVRLQACAVGLNAMLNHMPHGIGINQFPSEFERVHGYEKAAHSTYVQVGAELGYIGLMFYVGMIYVCVRSLIRAQTVNDDEERVRRILLCMLAAFCTSSWMINWAYNMSFFTVVGAVAAFHQLMEAKKAPVEAAATLAFPRAPIPAAITVMDGTMARALPAPGTLAVTTVDVMTVPVPDNVPPAQPSTPAAAGAGAVEPAAPTDPALFPAKFWSRPGILDALLIWGCTELLILFWEYVLQHF